MFIKKNDNQRQTERKLQKAGSVLGFTKNQVVTVEMVRQRFRELVMASHPDTAVGASEDIQELFSRYALHDIRSAKDLLLKNMENGDE